MKMVFKKPIVGAIVLLSSGLVLAAGDSYKVSGTLDIGVYRDYDGTTKTGSMSRSNVAFDGLKDLGNGLAGTVKLNARFFWRNPNTREFLVNEDSKYLFAGEATAGLKGDFGHVRVGRALTALWQNDWAYDAWYNFDQIASPAWYLWHGNGPADPNASAKSASFSRLNNGLFYASPKLGNFSVDASAGLKEQTGDKNTSLSLALKYADGNFNGMFAKEKNPAGNVVNFLAANYKLGALTLMGAYDHEKLVDGTRNRSTTVSAILVDGKLSYMAGLGRQLDYKANFYGLGVSYAYRPDTKIYASYGNKGNGLWGSTQNDNAFGLGVNYSF